MSEELLHQLKRQYDLLSERYVELQIAYSDFLSQAALKSSKVHPNTSTISTRSAVTTPCQSIGLFKTPRDSHSSHTDLNVAHSSLRKIQAELNTETTRRKMAENEVFRLQHLLNKAKSKPEPLSRTSVTPRTFRPDQASARLTGRTSSLCTILDDQLDALRASLAQSRIPKEESTELQRKCEAVRGVALWLGRELKDARSPLTARKNPKS